MTAGKRLAVLGLYYSGSTAIAGMLHRLGVNMGPPFWATSDDRADNNYYEPYDLSWHLRRWWQEPAVIERVPADARVRFLAGWIALQEAVSSAPAGAKHPLLSMCGPDLVAAWGDRTCFLWAWRPLEESIAGLERRAWFRGHEAPLQQRLWDALSTFEAAHPVVRIDWQEVRADPIQTARRLAALAGVEPSDQQVTSAAAFVRVCNDQWPAGDQELHTLLQGIG